MTPREFAEHLDCSYATALLRVMRDGLLVFRLGGADDGWRVRRSDLEKWIAQKRVRPAGSGPKARKTKAGRKEAGAAQGAVPEMNDADNSLIAACNPSPGAMSSTGGGS